MRYRQLQEAVEGAGHRFFDKGHFNLNLIGVRTDDAANNTFNDWMHIAYRDLADEEQCLSYRITTDPGVHFRKNPINDEGTGILVPTQNRGAWKIGLHRGEHALVQVKPVAVYRDNDCDSLLNFDGETIEHVMGGFNCHRASATGSSHFVDKWSAGCQVFANCYDHDVLIALACRSAAIHGNSFSYALLREGEIG